MKEVNLQAKSGGRDSTRGLTAAFAQVRFKPSQPARPSTARKCIGWHLTARPGWLACSAPPQGTTRPGMGPGALGLGLWLKRGRGTQREEGSYYNVQKSWGDAWGPTWGR